MSANFGALLLFLLFSFSTYSFLPAQINGLVQDESGSPLAGASVLQLPDSNFTYTNKEGRFQFPISPAGAYRLRVSFLGFEKLEKKFLPTQKELLITLHAAHHQLDEIVITDEHAKQESTLSAAHLSTEELAQNSQTTFVNSIEQLPGISAINVGVGIAKPVIRGLSSNRILLTQDGIKQEGQQWGNDHGLEVDPFAVERVEIVKGPASLQYGSDGLGGAINVMAPAIPKENSLSGGVLAVYQSNNQHIGGSAYVRANRRNIYATARYSQQDFGDYRVPVDSFVYQGFVFPVFDQKLKNTAGHEKSAHVSLGMVKSWGLSSLTYRYYQLAAGMLPAAVGLPLAYSMNPDFNQRDIDFPSQAVNHHKIAFNQMIYLGKSHVNINLGYQSNQRSEYSFPDFHNLPEVDPTHTLALALRLQTLSANAHLEHHISEQWKAVIGLNAQHQQNRAGGFEYLLPDFQVFRSGMFGLCEYKPQPRLLLSGGIRLDYGHNQTDFGQRYVYTSNGTITDSLHSPATDDPFFNWSASLGMNYSLRPDRLFLKLNLGKSFRIPYPAETVANGVHHGTFRHEQGNPALSSEKGYQLDASLLFQSERLEAEWAGYFNFFEGFIYLAPQAKFSPLPEAGQIYRYEQNDALYSGFELSWTYQLSPHLFLKQAAEYVWNINLSSSLSLPFTPQPSLLTSIEYRKAAFFAGKDFYLSLSDHYHLANGPDRVDRNERATPAYNLIHLSMGWKLVVGKHSLQLRLRAQNLLNTTYLNALSRYRLINVPEQGRNIILRMEIPLE